MKVTIGKNEIKNPLVKTIVVFIGMIFIMIAYAFTIFIAYPISLILVALFGRKGGENK
jgi:hypothetical protein